MARGPQLRIETKNKKNKRKSRIFSFVHFNRKQHETYKKRHAGSWVDSYIFV